MRKWNVFGIHILLLMTLTSASSFAQGAQARSRHQATSAPAMSTDFAPFPVLDVRTEMPYLVLDTHEDECQDTRLFWWADGLSGCKLYMHNVT